MLISQLYNDMISARKGNDPVAKSLMVTLYSESAMVGKNKRNGNSTDDEVLAVIKKFAANIEETIKLLTERNQPTVSQTRELEILAKYLPTQLSREQLVSVIELIISNIGATNPKFMGQIMSELKAKHNGQYDGKMAAELIKEKLS